MIWDFTCPDTIALSHLSKTSILAGAAASGAAAHKSLKYSDLLHSHRFIPVGVETMGVWGPGALELVTELGKCLAVSSGDRRSPLFLRQRIAMDVQRGNAVSVLGTFPSSVAVGEFALLRENDP